MSNSFRAGRLLELCETRNEGSGSSTIGLPFDLVGKQRQNARSLFSSRALTVSSRNFFNVFVFPKGSTCSFPEKTASNEAYEISWVSERSAQGGQIWSD